MPHTKCIAAQPAVRKVTADEDLRNLTITLVAYFDFRACSLEVIIFLKSSLPNNFRSGRAAKRMACTQYSVF